jgi:hypothetical protein
MTYIRIDAATSSTSLLEAVFRLFGQAAAARTETAADCRLTDEATLQAISRLSDHQLDDIGIRRKPRHVSPDHLGRNPWPAPAVTFDYFHAGI